MQISVFGAGYVGLVTAACLADGGHHVTCVDTDAAKVARIGNGDISFYEPGLSELVSNTVQRGDLEVTCDGLEGIRRGDVIFIAVGTPNGHDGHADISGVLSVARLIAENADDDRIIVLKSTVPVGTGDKVEEEIRRVRPNSNIALRVCSNPEFLREGSAIEDFKHGARIVVGTDNERVRAAMRDIYAPFDRNHDKLIFMGRRASELTKYAANSMLAARISFINEIAGICEAVGADVEAVREGVGSDPRIGYDFLNAGCGFGGSCFPKDLRALVASARLAGVDTPLLDAVTIVNQAQRELLFEKLSSAFDGDLAGKQIAVWGLSFKPNTDDVREAPAFDVVRSALAAGARVTAYDPKAAANFTEVLGDHDAFGTVRDRFHTLDGADALVICTEWAEFRSFDQNAVRTRMRGSVIVDGRNLYDPATMRGNGWTYLAFGR